MHEVIEDFDINLHSFKHVFKLLQQRRNFSMSDIFEQPKRTELLAALIIEAPITHEQHVFFDTEEIQSESAEEITIAGELMEKHPDIYDIVLKDGLLDLICECIAP